MPAEAWVTLVLAALIIAAAALGLIRVVFHLRATAATLDGVIDGVRVIADRTSTVPSVVPSVNASLKPVRDFTDTL